MGMAVCLKEKWEFMDDGMTYKIEGNEVLGFMKIRKRVVVIFFSSTDPKIGDQLNLRLRKKK